MSDDNKFSLGEILWEYADYTPPAKKVPAPLPPISEPVPGKKAPDGEQGMVSPQPASGRPEEPAARPQRAPAGPLPANQPPVTAGSQGQGSPSAPSPTPEQGPASGQKQASGPMPGQPARSPASPAQIEPDTRIYVPGSWGDKPAAGAPTRVRGANPPEAPKGRPAASPSPQTPPEEAPASGRPEETAPVEQAPPQEAAETGVPEDDGPDLIAFTPDPGAKPSPPPQEEPPAPAEQPVSSEEQTPAEGQNAAAAGQNAAEGQPPSQEQPSPEGRPSAPGEPAKGPEAAQGQTPQTGEARPQDQAEGNPPPQTGGQTGTQASPQEGPQAGAQAEAQTKEVPFRPFRERKAKAQAAPPPDVPPAQLAVEYGPGLPALKTKCIAGSVLAAILLLLALPESGLVGFLENLLPETFLLYTGLGLFVVCAWLGLDILKEGLTNLANGAPDGSTLTLFAALFTLADGVTTAAAPLREVSLPFFAPCALVLAFHLLGRYCDRSAKAQACRTAAAVNQPYLVTQDLGVMAGQSLCRKRLASPRGFGSQIRTKSQGEKAFQKLTPVLITACFCLSLVTTVAHHQPRLVLWSLSALFCAAATLGAPLTLSLPARMLGGHLAGLGVALAGWPGLQAAKGARNVLLLDQDVYPPGSVALASSRIFGTLSMERTVSYATSVIRASGSGLTFLFDKLLRAEGGSYLPIERVTMQENGLIGQCQGQEILVGNSEFMSRQAIALPPGIKARDAVFCAVDRTLAGVFVLKYTLHPSILPSLQAMVAHRLAPVLATRDFNFNPHRLRLFGRLPTDQLSYPDLQRRVTLSAPDQAHSETLVAVLSREGLAPFSQALIAAGRIRRAAVLNSFFARLGACIGVVLTATLSSAGALGAMCAWNLSLFLLLWLAPVVLISLWTRQY